MPLLRWFLAYAAGVLASAPSRPESFFAFFLAALALGHALWLTARQKNRPPAYWVLLLALFAAGAASSLWRFSEPSPSHVWNHLPPDRRVAVEGVVTDLPERFFGRARYRLRLQKLNAGSGWVPVHGTAQISYYGEGSPLTWGDRARVSRIRLKRPRNFRNPGGFDYERFLRLAGVDVTGGTARRDAFAVLGRAPLGAWRTALLTLRERMQAVLAEGLPQESGALLMAMVFGDKTGLRQDTQKAFRATGLAHLLAVSGLHVGFVAAAAYLLFYSPIFHLMLKFRPDWARFGYARKAAALGAAVPVLGYMLLAGPKVSALRAGILVLLYLLALVVNRERDLLHTLVLAAFLILLWEPGALFQAGFQLSFLAVLLILLTLQWMAPPAGEAWDPLIDVPWYRRWATPGPPGTWPARVVDACVATAFLSSAAWLATFPVLLYQFHRVSPGGLLMNLWAVPLASLLIPSTLLVLVLGLFWKGLALILLIPLGWLAHLFLLFNHLGASLPGMSVHLPRPPWPWLVFYFALVLGAPYWFYRKRTATAGRPIPGVWQRWGPRLLALAAAVVVVWLVFPRWLTWPSDKLEVWVLDVGQGESIFIEFPNGQNLLLDGGGYFTDALDVGTRVVGSFLWSRGIGRLDYLGATHSDQDHIDGVESVLDHFNVRRFLDRADGLRDERFSRLRRRAMRQGAKPLWWRPGESLAVGEARLRLVHPTPEFNHSLDEPLPARLGNDQSWVIRLEYRQFRMLLTGDITRTAERWLVQTGAPVRAEVLKAPHHGSRNSNSPAFLRAVGARDVMISSGTANVFRHPHPEALTAYQKQGLRVWRTDRQGALRLVTDGVSYQIQTHAQWSHWD